MSVRTFDITPPLIASGSAYYFTTDSGDEYEVRFARKKDDLLSVSMAFGVINEEYDGEEYTATNKGEVYKVMHTIIEIVKMYLEQHPNLRSLEFSGEPTSKEDGTSTTVRLRLYERYVNRVFSKKEWKYTLKANKMIIKRKKE